jgi:diamine N-acetyltransferase
MSSVSDRVTLREITAETVRAVVKLAVAENQTKFVASNGMSLAQALFAPEAWYRAIYLDDELVGFVMLSDDSLLDPPPEQPEVGLWRFMVDARYQGQGVGRAALQLIIDHVRRKGRFEKLSLSYVPEDGGPEAFYRSFGFLPTGEIDDGEVVMELELGGPTTPPPAVEVAPARIAYVNVFVRDLDRATEFYRDTLGLQLQYASPEHGYASFAAGGVRLGIAVPGREQAELVGRHTGVGLEVADLEAEYARLSGLGARFTMPPTRQPLGGFMSLVADPDGNVFYLDQVAAERS